MRASTSRWTTRRRPGAVRVAAPAVEVGLPWARGEFPARAAVPDGGGGERSDCSLAIGSTLMCAIYAGGHVSGANYNPAVSLAVWVRGKLSFIELITYMIVQVLAAACAWFAAGFFVESPGYPKAGATGTGYGALIVETVVTFALCHTVLHVATTNGQKNNSYYGLAIGFVVVSGAVSVGGVSGGAFNPLSEPSPLLPGISISRSSPTLSRRATTTLGTFMSSAWVYSAGPFAGGLLAGVLFRITHPGESENPAAAPLFGLREAIAPYLIELIGTFLLCFTGHAAASSSVDSVLVPLSIGGMLMAQVYAVGPRAVPTTTLPSPLVSTFADLRAVGAGDDLPPADRPRSRRDADSRCGQRGGLIMYTTAIPPGYPSPTATPVVALAAEAIATFFLVFVVLQTATPAKTAGNSFFGLAIGLTVTAMAITFGPLSGGAFNPAVGVLGLTSADSLASMLVSYNWVYAAGPLLGGLVAAFVYRVVVFDEFVQPYGYNMV